MFTSSRWITTHLGGKTTGVVNDTCSNEKLLSKHFPGNIIKNMAKYGWVKLSEFQESSIFFTFLLKKKHSIVLIQPVFDLIEEFRFLGEFFIYIDAGFPGWELEWFHT